MGSDEPIRRSLSDVVDLCGTAVALALVDKLPGTEQYVPTRRRLTPDHVLVRKLGIDMAEKLAEFFHGETIHVTRSFADEARIRRRIIFEAKAAGAKCRDIALRAGCTMRFVRMVLSGVDGDDDDRQGSLL